MKRTHEVPLIAGMAVGLAVGFSGVVLGMLLASKDGPAMRRRAQQATRSLVSSRMRTRAARRLGLDRDLHLWRLAQQARQDSERAAKSAGEQHLPKAKEARSGALAYAGLHGASDGSAG